MSPYEIIHQRRYRLRQRGARALWLRRLLDACYPAAAWLNPEPERLWEYRHSIRIVRDRPASACTRSPSTGSARDPPALAASAVAEGPSPQAGSRWLSLRHGSMPPRASRTSRKRPTIRGPRTAPPCWGTIILTSSCCVSPQPADLVRDHDAAMKPSIICRCSFVAHGFRRLQVIDQGRHRHRR